jgi:hypothetical protein
MLSALVRAAAQDLERRAANLMEATPMAATRTGEIHTVATPTVAIHAGIKAESEFHIIDKLELARPIGLPS